MDRYGTWGQSAAENISYGSNTGIGIVMQLFVDDGVDGRGHRVNLMAESNQVSGVASGAHSEYRDMTCITYAGSYVDNNPPADVQAETYSVDDVSVEIDGIACVVNSVTTE